MAETLTFPELTLNPDLTGGERIDDLLNRVEQYAAHPDPLRVNFAALRAGQVWVHLRRRAADKETHRKKLHLEIAEDLVAHGLPPAEEGGERAKVTKTAAPDQARADKRYTDYLDELRALEERRDRAEVLWKSLHQRAYLLAGGRAAALDEGGNDGE